MNLAWRVASSVVAIAAAALIAGYSAIVPAFEAPDEPGHFRYVQLLAGGHGLPVQGSAGDFDPEFSQPPLYYALHAVVARLSSASGAAVPDWDHHNPYQNATVEGNVNLYSHPAAEGLPWTGQILQLHLMRLLNLVFAAVTLVATYGIGREIGLSPALALTASATLGLLPQFDFISGALNADNAVTATAALALYLLLRWLRQPTGFRLATLLGLATAAAMLSKLSGLAVLALVLGAMLWCAWRSRQAHLAGQAALAGGVALALAGWWYVRNLALYGDPLGWQPMLTAIGAMLRPRPLNALEAASVLFQQRATALGVFGWNNLRLPQGGVYVGVDVVGVLALVGLLLFLSRLRERRGEGVAAARPLTLGDRSPWVPSPNLSHRGGRGMLLLWVAVFAAGLVRWVEVNGDAAQWRLLFPAFPALVVLLAVGLRRLHGLVAAALPVTLACLSAASLLLVVRPAYIPEPAYAGPIQHRVNVLFGDALELAGYDDPQPRDTNPGEPVALTLYWRAVRPLVLDEIVDLAGLDASGQAGLKESSWPQQGRAPTSGLIPGQVVRDRHVIAGTAQLTPGVWRLFVDVFQPLEGAPRLPVASGGTTVSVGRFLILPARRAAPDTAEASFTGNLALLGHSQSMTSGRLQVSLQWLATGPVEADYTVFVHALDSAGKLVAQNDSEPAAGRFPTSLLGPGVLVEDVHSLDLSGLPAGSYQLEVGLYDAQTGVRPRLSGKDGDALVFPLTLS